MKSACFCITYILLGFYGIAAAEPVHFRDANLKAAVEYELGIVDPTPDDMLNLTYLVAGGCNIIDLTGLEYAHNLEYLYLFDNQIWELSPLANLDYLDELWLNGNEIRDISPLGSLYSLDVLSLYDNQIRDITPLYYLTSLNILWLDQNLVQDISVLGNLYNLQDLWLDDNQINNIASLTVLRNLSHLSITNNPLNETAYCIGFDIIQYHNPWIVLDCDPDPNPGNCPELIIPDYSLHSIIARELGFLMPTFNDLLTLTELDASNCNILDLEDLDGARNLQYLYLSNNQIEDISPMIWLRNIKELRFDNNQITDITPLEYMDNLEVLWLDHNLIQDISSLDSLHTLRDLRLDNNQIQDITPIALYGSTNLEYLSLTDNFLNQAAYCAGLDFIQIRNSGIDLRCDPDPDPGNCPELYFPDIILRLTIARNLGVLLPSENDISNLTSLVINGKDIVDLTGLEYMISLKMLWADDNIIREIHPLTALTNLERLFLTNNPLSSKAYCFDLPLIEAHNPNLSSYYFSYDPNPNLLTADCTTSIEELGILAGYWMSPDCSEHNYWCDGADMDFSGSVTLEDFCIFCSLWLAE